MMLFRTIPAGQQVATWDKRGHVRIIAGPKRIPTWGLRIEPLQHIAAGPDHYLRIVHQNGHTEHIAGPAERWRHPVEHRQIETLPVVDIDAHQAVVVYRPAGGEVERRVVRGPARFVPGPTEWLHGFRWHGADPKDPTRKIPRALEFTKLRVIPDQMYVDVPEVRTRDDALVIIKLMVFFELEDVERMLDRTHDPMADFINAVTADIIDHVGRYTFEAFKEHTDEFNELTWYSQLTERAATIGYRIGKVVYRGYHANDALQVMHDQAIERRTHLKLEDETERQAQELADLKLQREQAREQQKQAMEAEQVQHRNRLTAMETEQTLADERQRHEATIAAQADRQRLEREHEQAMNAERLHFLGGIKEQDVDLTRYLVAQYQHPDRLIRIDGTPDARVHLHHGQETA